MRWSDLLAFFTSTFWLGCNTAFAIVPAVMFSAVKGKYVDASTEQVGELFGLVAMMWGNLTLGLLAVLALARLAGWLIRLRHREFYRSSLIGIFLFAAIAVFTVLAARSYDHVEVHRSTLEDLDATSPERPAVAAQFALEHERSVLLSKILTALLLAQSVVLAVSLMRRSQPSTRASATPIAA